MCCLGAASCCCCAWEGLQGDLFAFLLTPCCLDSWHGLVRGAAWCCGMQLALPRMSPWSCSRGINHGCAAAAAALGAPSLLGRWLQLLLLSLLCPPQHEPCSSSGSQPCLLHTAGGLCCPGDAGHSCWDGPMCYPAGRRAWGGLLGDTSVHPRPHQHRGSRGILDQKSL